MPGMNLTGGCQTKHQFDVDAMGGRIELLEEALTALLLSFDEDGLYIGRFGGEQERVAEARAALTGNLRRAA